MFCSLDSISDGEWGADIPESVIPEEDVFSDSVDTVSRFFTFLDHIGAGEGLRGGVD